ncbi:MAG: hypothetical protein ACRD3E_06610, partial [Terriglobales bacterium]
MVFVLMIGRGTAAAQAVPGQCGYDRWPVKILSDKDRTRVNMEPTNTTVAKIGAIPIHEVPYPYDRRIEPEELHVYRVTARLLRVKREQDSDLHLLLADLDDPEKRMIAEIPAPECAVGTGHEEEYKAARAVLRSIAMNTIVEVTGVGFFDFLHEQSGAAKNGIELHPVLK